MSTQDQDHKNTDAPCSFWRSRYALGYLVIGAVAAYFLLTEHLAHVAGVLPYLLLLACPLMHVFMHHGHGGHGGHGRHGHHHENKEGHAEADKSAANETGKSS